jgi:secreted trypsin-like serine protease
MKRLLLALATASSALALNAAPAHAIVGGHDAAAGAYPSIAEVHLGKAFLCTGTLVAPNWVLTAGHCGSMTGSAVATPISFPGPLIDVYVGSNQAGQGESVPVLQAIIPPGYIATQGYDVTLLQLASNSSKTPTKVAGSGETASWAAGTTETIAWSTVTTSPWPALLEPT